MGSWRQTVAAAALGIDAAAKRWGDRLLLIASAVMRREDFDAIAVAGWNRYQRRDEEILTGLFDWERDVVLPVLRPGGRVLVVGCGTGRDLLALLQMGYRAEGVDMARDATAVARRVLADHGFSAAVYDGAVETVALPGRYDAIVLSTWCYGLVPESSRRVALLRGLAPRLDEGGLLVIPYRPPDAWHLDAAIPVARLLARTTGSDWQPERGDTISAPTPAWRTVYFEHRFAPDAIEAEAREAGLAVARHHRGLAGVLMATVGEPIA